MQISRIAPLVSGVVGLAALLGSGAAMAQGQRQTAQAPVAGTSSNGSVYQDQAAGLPPVDASQNTNGTGNREVFQLLGLSGEIEAPVTSAYNADTSYRTFAGQPMNGANAVLAQTIDGAP